MENECVINLTKDFVNRVMYGHRFWQYYSFWCSPYISKKRLTNMIKNFASYDKEEEVPLVLIDSSLLENGKSGILITNKTIYYKLNTTTGKGWYNHDKLDLKEISNLYFKPCMSGSYLMINNEQVGLSPKFSSGGAPERDAAVLNELLASFIEALKENQ